MSSDSPNSPSLNDLHQTPGSAFFKESRQRSENLITPPPIDPVPSLSSSEAFTPSRLLDEKQPKAIGPHARHLMETSKSMRAQQTQNAEGRAPLSELAVLAQELNAESDGLNSLIQTYNQKLQTLNLGVEVWCKGTDGVEFGFRRLGDPSEWQLAVQFDDPFDVNHQKRHMPLLKRSRDERIEGLEFVPEIVRQLKIEAERKLTAIRKAKLFADSL